MKCVQSVQSSSVRFNVIVSVVGSPWHRKQGVFLCFNVIPGVCTHSSTGGHWFNKTSRRNRQLPDFARLSTKSTIYCRSVARWTASSGWYSLFVFGSQVPRGVCEKVFISTLLFERLRFCYRLLTQCLRWWCMKRMMIWWSMMIWRCMMNDDEWWWMMMNDDEWWWMMMNDDEWWWMMMNDDEWWWMMMNDDEWWWMMMNDDEWWWMMMNYDELW
jgi:hypothetical protein